MTGSPRLLFGVAVPLSRFTLWVAGVRYRIVGLDRLDPGTTYLFMPNHQSNVDPPLVLVALRRRARFMAKASLFRIPLFGQALRVGGFVPVVREDRDRAIEAVNLAAEKLQSGIDFVVFPEGTRSLLVIRPVPSRGSSPPFRTNAQLLLQIKHSGILFPQIANG